MTTAINIEDYQEIARKKLPRPVFDFIEGGSGDETSIAANRSAFDRLSFVPRVLVDVGKPDLTTTFCGSPLQTPIMLAPTGHSGIVHPDGERAAAVVAAELGTLAFVSTMSTYTIEEIAATVDPPPWFQLYSLKDKGLASALVERAAAAKLPGICLTVDTAVGSRRERDLRNGWSVPPKIVGRNGLSFLAHPAWVARAVRHRRVLVRNIDPLAPLPKLRNLITAASASTDAVLRQLDPSVTWDDLAKLRAAWGGSLAVKGILNPADAARAVALGANAIIVSNHGGRQLDGACATLDALPGIVDAVGDQADVAIDGGVRRGTDVIKALCLGARACLIGRPWLWGLAAGGTAGVRAALDLLRVELEIGLALVGQPNARSLDQSYLAPNGL
jgi:L-lactate dehydrogenase (cytochrome)